MSTPLIHDERVQKFRDIDIYPVTAEALSNGRSDFDVLDGIIAGGARVIQLRDKMSSVRELYSKAKRFRDVTAANEVLLIINDHIDIAIAVDADGVHLGQDDFPAAIARAMIPDKIMGCSTHTLEEAEQAERDGADYVNIGPIYATGTKQGLHTFLGPEMITRIAPHLSVPFTVMGGIKQSNLPDVLAAGAARIAVVTAITQAPDIATAVRDFRGQINVTAPTLNESVAS